MTAPGTGQQDSRDGWSEKRLGCDKRVGLLFGMYCIHDSLRLSLASPPGLLDMFSPWRILDTISISESAARIFSSRRLD